MPQSEHTLQSTIFFKEEHTHLEWKESIFEEMKDRQVSVGPFTLTDSIGHGSTSKVFKAIHEPSQQIYAIKIVLKIPDDRIKLSKIKREVAVLRYLQYYPVPCEYIAKWYVCIVSTMRLTM